MIQPSASPAGSAREAGQEIVLDPKELLYTRTDERGVIKAGNEAFAQIAGYRWEELIGAPHRIIRHPDMPKGFFHLFWKYLKAGEPAVGYIKNRAKDGRFYWVLATAVPCDGGYFSVRIRPASALFQSVRAEYAKLHRREELEKLTPETSAQILLARLQELGFRSYPEFMSQAFQEETTSRNAALGRPTDRVATHLSALVTALKDALNEQARLVGLFDSLKLLPVNMRLIAARLEPQGGPISQISMNYKTSFDNISDRLSTFVTGEGNICGQMDIAVRRSLILANCARLHQDMSASIRRPPEQFAGQDRRLEHEIVARLGQTSHERGHASLIDALRLAAALIAAAFEIRRMVLGLDTIRILGRVESRRDNVSESACSATLDQIDSVQAEITQSLQSLSNLAVAIQTGLTLVNAARGSASGSPSRSAAPAPAQSARRADPAPPARTGNESPRPAALEEPDQTYPTDRPAPPTGRVAAE